MNERLLQCCAQEAIARAFHSGELSHYEKASLVIDLLHTQVSAERLFWTRVGVLAAVGIGFISLFRDKNV
jgi:hypothetical protein